MNIMNLPNGPGWSPDGGNFWVNGDMLYWSDGSIWDMRDGGVIRTIPPLPGHENGVPETEWRNYENYSEWSDEKRSAMLAEHKRKGEEYEIERSRYIERQRKFIESAKAKLTEEEYEAVY